MPVRVGEKLPVKHLETAAGREMYLSPIGFWAEGITETTEDSAWWELTLHRADGTERAVHLDMLAGYEEETPEAHTGYETAKVYEVTDGMTYDCDNPASYTAFVDVDGVTAIDWAEYRFEVVPEENSADTAESLWFTILLREISFGFVIVTELECDIHILVLIRRRQRDGYIRYRCGRFGCRPNLGEIGVGHTIGGDDNPTCNRIIICHEILVERDLGIARNVHSRHN